MGDFGFLLGIALMLAYTGSLDYGVVFGKAGEMAKQTIEIFPGAPWSLITVICILLFIGAMGKSAQFPLHVWLPDSMEGPTPISALIHAATMVTAGIFMVARMSPLFELSTTALSCILVIGAITAFFMGLLGIVQNDIKRVVAYSTLSQLGYMAVGLGASAYAASMFHLVTHAFFKALLFLAAGSVIIALHHEQDMRRMGGLRKYMPITYWTALVGSLALCGIPPFAGFFSKDSLIEAVHLSTTPGAGIAYAAVLSGVFVTALYTFRMMFMTFHGKERFQAHGHAHGQSHGTRPRRSTRPCRHAARVTLGRDGSIDPAGDPLGVCRLGLHRAVAVRWLLRRFDRSDRTARRAGQAGRGVPRRSRLRPAWVDRDAFLASAGRHRHRLVPLPDTTGAGRRDLPGR